MNLLADPILTPSKDKKDANRCQPSMRKREKTVLIESRLETREGGTSIGKEMCVDKGITYSYLDAIL